MPCIKQILPAEKEKKEYGRFVSVLLFTRFASHVKCVTLLSYKANVTCSPRNVVGAPLYRRCADERPLNLGCVWFIYHHKIV